MTDGHLPAQVVIVDGCANKAAQRIAADVGEDRSIAEKNLDHVVCVAIANGAKVRDRIASGVLSLPDIRSS